MKNVILILEHSKRNEIRCKTVVTYNIFTGYFEYSKGSVCCWIDWKESISNYTSFVRITRSMKKEKGLSDSDVFVRMKIILPK